LGKKKTRKFESFNLKKKLEFLDLKKKAFKHFLLRVSFYFQGEPQELFTRHAQSLMYFDWWPFWSLHPIVLLLRYLSIGWQKIALWSSIQGLFKLEEKGTVWFIAKFRTLRREQTKFFSFEKETKIIIHQSNPSSWGSAKENGAKIFESFLKKINLFWAQTFISWWSNQLMLTSKNLFRGN